jgi:GrpB-like predicted nucleotidyltransferase (UPF0157 family)/ribosomal protein S18 acetylase RimI-like enzyme
MTNEVVVEPYNPDWPNQFEEIKRTLWSAVGEFATSIEHVGSTSVPGLAAKPILDIDIVIHDMSLLDRAILALGELGYEHRGNLGIEGREAFRAQNPTHRHNLYVCLENCLALRNHLCLRDALRAIPSLRDEYAAIKFRLAREFPDSIDHYIEGKTEFILRVLHTHGHDPESLEQIRLANLAPPAHARPTMKIRRASESDAQALANLGQSTFVETFAEYNTKEDMDLYVTKTFGAEKQMKEIRDPNRWIEIAWSGEQAVGFLHLVRSKPDSSVTGPKPIELLRLYVDSRWHGKGIGAALMERTIEIARKEGFQTLWLGVWEKNFRAQAFYAKHGFNSVGRQVFKLGTDEQNDFIMVIDLR